MRRRLRPWRVEVGVLDEVDFERAGQPGLDRGEADLAVALRAVAVAGREQRAFGPNRKIQHCAGAELLVVEVAAERARHHRTDAADVGRRRHAHHAEERVGSQHHTPRRLDRAGGAVDAEMDQALVGKVFRQRAHAGLDDVEAPVVGQLHIDDLDAQRVAGHRATDGDGAGEDVRPQLRLHGCLDRTQFRAHVIRAAVAWRFGDAAADAVKRKGFAGLDGGDGLQGCIEVAPMDGVG